MRRKILQLRWKGMSVAQIADLHLSPSRATILRICGTYEETGGVETQCRGRRWRLGPMQEAHVEWLVREVVKTNLCNAFLFEMVNIIADEFGLRYSQSTVCRTILAARGLLRRNRAKSRYDSAKSIGDSIA